MRFISTSLAIVCICVIETGTLFGRQIEGDSSLGPVSTGYPVRYETLRSLHALSGSMNQSDVMSGGSAVGMSDTTWLEAFFAPKRVVSPWERNLGLWTGVLAFAGFDYVAYNQVRHDADALFVYRGMQASVQALIAYALYELFDWQTAAAFNLVWWTFGADFAYCGYAEVFNPGGRWDSRGVTSKVVMGNAVTWAWWTPIGIARGMDNKKIIAGDTLIAQALIGAALAVTITVAF